MTFSDSVDVAKFLYVRNAAGGIVPPDTLVTLTRTTGVSQISRYNGVRCVNFDANVGEGFSSGEALAALVFVFLSLVALYESWRLPLAVILSVPTAIFGALLAEVVTGNLASVYMQIGMLFLIGLTAKNAILIVEFAKVKVDGGAEPARARLLATD